MHIQITKKFAINTGGVYFHGALIQGDSFRVVGGFHYVAVQAIKAGFVVFTANVPRNRMNFARRAAREAGIFEGF